MFILTYIAIFKLIFIMNNKSNKSPSVKSYDNMFRCEYDGDEINTDLIMSNESSSELQKIKEDIDKIPEISLCMKSEPNLDISQVDSINRCIICFDDLGDSNPRQYCYKTYCPYENNDNLPNIINQNMNYQNKQYHRFQDKFLSLHKYVYQI